MVKSGVFAGTFDPFTMGHYDIVSRASRLFDKVYVGVAENTSGKNCKLSIEKRTEIVKNSLFDLPNVTVQAFDCFLVDFTEECGSNTIIRGLRTSNDFEYEKALTEVYKSQNPGIEILYLIASHNYCHISSTIVRELAIMGGNMKGYVNPRVEQLVLTHYNKRG